jgi:hypothetical protein
VAAESTETQALARAQMHVGVEKALDSVRDTGWWVLATSDIGKKPVTNFLESSSLGNYMNMVLARSRLD